VFLENIAVFVVY